MASATFDTKKNSIHTNHHYEPEFDNFFLTYKGKLIRGQLPDYPRSIYKNSMKHMRRYIAKIQGEQPNRTKKKGKSARRTLKENDQAELEKEQEISMYKPLALALTRASFDLTPRRINDVLIFADHHDRHLTVMWDTGGEQPDLVSYFASREKVRMFLGQEKFECFDEEDIPAVAHRLGGVGEVKNDRKMNKAEESSNGVIKTEEEMFTESDEGKQLFRYVFVQSRHNPAPFLVFGFFANRAVFRLVALGLDYHVVWPQVQWNSEKAVQTIYGCVKLILDEAIRTYPPEVPRLMHTNILKNRTIAGYTAQIKGRQFRLLPIFYGRGSGRKPFVALAVAEDDPTFVRVFKYSWYPINQARQESAILRSIKTVPGVVHVDEELSIDMIDDNGAPAFGMSNAERKRSLLALKTVAYPLCACRTVVEFLEAMYDLLELLRYLVQEKNVLHRDVSWTNVLIVPVDHEEENEQTTEHESASAPGRKEVGAQDNKTGDGIPHEYRFMSDILNEHRRRIRIALADFDYASDLSGCNVDDLKNATGTWMFMASDVLKPRGVDHMGRANPAFFIQTTTTESALEGCEGKYADESERVAWDDFYKDEFERLDWAMTSKSFQDAEIKQSFQHGAVHDAESVFYICILFFSRIWPLDEKIKATERRALEVERGKLFEKLRTKAPGSNVELRSILSTLRDQWCPSLQPFFTMLRAIANYLEVPWYNVASTRRGERYEFHLHDFMQRLFLKEIKRMRTTGDPVRLEQNPLLVRISQQVFGNRFSALSKVIVSPRRREEAGETPNLKPGPSTSRAAGHEAKPDARTPEDRSKRDDTSTIDSQTMYIVPVERPTEMSEKERNQFKDLPEKFLDIRWWKEQETLWLACDKLKE